jgi:hypothetical protein
MRLLRAAYLVAVFAWAAYTVTNPWVTADTLPVSYGPGGAFGLTVAQGSLGLMIPGLVIGLSYWLSRSAARDGFLHIATAISLGLVVGWIALLVITILSIGLALTEPSIVCGTLAAGVVVGLIVGSWRWFHPRAAPALTGQPSGARKRWLLRIVQSGCVVLVWFLISWSQPLWRTRLADTEYWIDRLGATYLRIEGNEWGLKRGPDPKPPRDALRRIGPNAVPICITALDATNGYQRRIGAVDALRVYGPAARPAVPVLIDAILDVRNFTEDGRQQGVRDVAIQTILRTGPGLDDARAMLTAAVRGAARADHLPPFAADVSGPSTDAGRRRIWAAYALMWIDPLNRDAVGTLAAGAMHADRDIQRDAIVVLNKLGIRGRLQPIEDPIIETLVSAIVKAIESRPDDGIRTIALMILERLGPAARNATPALRAWLQTSDEEQWRNQILMTLKAISAGS